MGAFYVYIFIPKKKIRNLPLTVIVRDISKKFKGQSSFTTKVNYMLIEDGDKKLYYLTDDEYELRPFIQFVINESIFK